MGLPLCVTGKREDEDTKENIGYWLQVILGMLLQCEKPDLKSEGQDLTTFPHNMEKSPYFPAFVSFQTKGNVILLVSGLADLMTKLRALTDTQHIASVKFLKSPPTKGQCCALESSGV